MTGRCVYHAIRITVAYCQIFILKKTDLMGFFTVKRRHCCDRKSRAACAQSFALWQQATIEFTCHDHSIIACSRHIYVWCCSSRTSRSWWITHLMQHHRRGCNNTKLDSKSRSGWNKPAMGALLKTSCVSPRLIILTTKFKTATSGPTR